MARYGDRLDTIASWQSGLEGLASRLPAIPLDYTPSQNGSLALKGALYICGCAVFASEARDAFLTLWKARHLAIVSLPVRFVHELWGATHYAHQTLLLVSCGDTQRADERIRRLMLGARSEVELPWGGYASEKSVHVMDLVKSLVDVLPDAVADYAFLCESCHPSFLRATAWSLSGSIPMFDNVKFSEQVQSLTDRTLGALERGLEGLGVDARDALRLALPYIEDDYKRTS